MKKQEAIEYFKNKLNRYIVSPNEMLVSILEVIDVIEQIEDERIVVPSFVIDYYERYNEHMRSLDEWFITLQNKAYRQQSEILSLVFDWLYGEDGACDDQRAHALLTLVVKGPSAVEIEKEQLYTVELPNPNRKGPSSIYLYKDHNTGKVFLDKGTFNPRKNRSLRLTEREIKKDYAWLFEFAKKFDN